MLIIWVVAKAINYIRSSLSFACAPKHSHNNTNNIFQFIRRVREKEKKNEMKFFRWHWAQIVHAIFLFIFVLCRLNDIDEDGADDANNDELVDVLLLFSVVTATATAKRSQLWLYEESKEGRRKAQKNLERKPISNVQLYWFRMRKSAQSINFLWAHFLFFSFHFHISFRG